MPDLVDSSENVPTEKTQKKKDKKKPPKKEAKDDPKEKKPSKVSKIKEEILRRRQEEERARREEEEEEKRIEDERLKQLEKEKREREAKEKRKQKEKERKQRLKEEGKLLTDRQKEDRRKVVELMQARGIELPLDRADNSSGQNKKPVYSKLKRKSTMNTEVIIPQVPENIVKIEEDSLADWETMADALEEMEPVDASTEEKVIAESDSESSDEIIIERSTITEEEKEQLISLAKAKILKKHEHYEATRDEEHLRAGVICVLGHVDTGKTKILDKLRNTNVQAREAGGITQQIGATNVPLENIRAATKMCSDFNPDLLKVPGMLIIDTPGHESFSNLRVRGTSLCDLAILVVDLMHGLEEQTKESIRILHSRKTPFIVALNKIDRLYGWQSRPDSPVSEAIKRQDTATKNDFEDHLKKVVQDFALMELNVKLFYENDNPMEYVSLVPTSAHTGEGIGDLLAALCNYLQNNLSKRLAFTEELEASVMEVKEIDGLGTTIDVILVNGTLHEGDTIVLAGQEGPISTQIRGILQPDPMSELRVKNAYHHLKEVKGAQGVKLIAKDLEMSLAGLPLHVSSDVSEELYYKQEVSRGLKAVLKGIAVQPLGVYVVASTLGSLESLLVYLKSQKIPYSGISIGTVHRKDVMRASIMVERDPKWAVILAFDVKVHRDAQKLADEAKVRIFTSNIIYTLEQQLTQYIEDLKRGNRHRNRDLAVFPCKLRILPEMIFNKRAPIVVGVQVESGLLRQGTPICVPSKDFVHLGRIFSIESNHKPVLEARIGQEVCIRIDPLDSEAPKLYGRHFDQNDMLISKITRDSIDIVKEFFRTDLTKEDWKLMVELKKVFNII